MDELWIPHSADPNDPRSRLSARARRRIARAQLEADGICMEAVSLTTAKSLTGAKKKFALNQASYRAARHLLTAVFAEFKRAGFGTGKLLAAMKDEVQAAASSLDLYLSQEHELNGEFFILSHADPKKTTKANPHRKRKAKVLEWCQEHDNMTLEELAQKVLRVGRMTFYRWWKNPANAPRVRKSIERDVDAL